MTICPKCGKAYDITPEACGECGTALTDPAFRDPFAEAAKEEAALREQANLRRAKRLNLPAPAAPETEQTADTADGMHEIDDSALPAESAAKKKHTGLRVLAVTAALASAAGGGWYYHRTRQRTESGSMDVRYFVGGQPYFYDGMTGKTVQLGSQDLPDPKYSQQQFWGNTTVSADRSRIFFPVLRDEDECVDLCYLDLKEENAEPVPLQLFDPDGGTEQNDRLLTGYQLLDESGSSVLMQLELFADEDYSYGVPYTVWQEPALHGGNSAAMPVRYLLDAYPLKNRPGCFLAFCAEQTPDQPAPVFINLISGSKKNTYKLELFSENGSSSSEVAGDIFEWEESETDSDDKADGVNYLLCFSAAETGPEYLKELELQDHTYILSQNDDVKAVTSDSFAEFAESGSRFYHGTHVQRVDLADGKVSDVCSESENCSDYGVKCLPNGDVWQNHRSSSSLLSYHPNGTVTALPLSSFYDCEAISWKKGIFWVRNENGCSLMVHNDRYLLDFSAFYPQGLDSLRMKGIADKAGGRVLLKFSEESDDDGAEESCSFFLCDLSDPDEITPKKIGQCSGSGDMAFCGKAPVLMLSQKRDAQADSGETVSRCYQTYTLTCGGETAAENWMCNFRMNDLFADHKNSILFFTEPADPDEKDCELRTLFCMENGKVTCIADRIVHAVFGSAICDEEKRSFAFLRQTEDGQYEIRSGSFDARSLADCTVVASVDSTEKAALYIP